MKKILEQVVSSDLNKNLLSIEKLVSGGNNQVFRIICDDAKLLAKIYFYNGDKSQNRRLHREFDALSFLWQKGIRQIPEPLHIDIENQIGFYNFIDGEKIKQNDIQNDDLLQAAGFLGRLSDVSQLSEAEQIGTASDACLNLDDYWQSIETRYQQINKAIAGKKFYHHVIDFFKKEFVPFLEQARSCYEKSLSEINQPHLKPILSPSDFGFHNALKLRNGEIIFIDFEYFGWDDPAKLIADFFHHPAMSLSEKQKQFFLNSFLQITKAEETLIQQIRLVYFAVGLKWCLLMINVCLPDVMARKRFARSDLQDEIVIEEQLEKSKTKLRQLQEANDHPLFF